MTGAQSAQGGNREIQKLHGSNINIAIWEGKIRYLYASRNRIDTPLVGQDGSSEDGTGRSNGPGGVTLELDNFIGTENMHLICLEGAKNTPVSGDCQVAKKLQTLDLSSQQHLAAGFYS